MFFQFKEQERKQERKRNKKGLFGHDDGGKSMEKKLFKNFFPTN